MKEYRTYWIINHRDSDVIQSLPKSNFDFELLLYPDPTGRFWQSKKSETQLSEYDPNLIDELREYHNPQNELVIKAESIDKAEDILSIIHGGMLLSWPEPSFTSPYFSLKERDELSGYEKNELFRKYSEVGFGCRVLVESYNQQECVYAIEKYKVSLDLLSFSPHSIDPTNGQIFNNYDLRRRFHTRAAFAIISGYSVIEELGLEIKSSSKTPRFIHNQWNEKVINDINCRLEKIGILSDMTIDLCFRGELKTLEDSIKPTFGYNSEWITYGEEIRDKSFSFPEAIHYCSYLRNYFAAHRFCTETEFFTPYEVYNVQDIARNLILRKLGLWDAMLQKNL